MYKNILVALENRPSDEVILNYIRPLAQLTGARLLLTHVADGFVARYQDVFNLQDSPEIIADQQYLERIRSELTAEGFIVSAVLARGKPAEQIVQVAQDSECDLIAMSTHGHRFVGDLVFGSVASTVRHLTDIPVLLVPARQTRKNQPRAI